MSSVSSVKSASSVGLWVSLKSVSSVSSLYFCDFSWTQVKVSLFLLSFIHSVRNFFFGLSSDLATPSLFLFSVLATSSLVWFGFVNSFRTVIFIFTISLCLFNLKHELKLLHQFCSQLQKLYLYFFLVL